MAEIDDAFREFRRLLRSFSGPLISSIRQSRPINDLKNVAESTLTAIMGRMSAYTGKAVTWDQALNSKLDTFPAHLDLHGRMEEPPVPRPGVTELI